MVKRILIGLVVAILVVVGVGAIVVITSRSAQTARLDVAAVEGTNPEITDPHTGLIPLVKLAKPVGWRPGETPTPAPGLTVRAFATGLDHPRSLLALPNGDVLVAETNAPPKPADSSGFHGWIEKKIMGQAGAGGKSANRITLLRDVNGDGVADERHVLLTGLNSPFGMALLGDRLVIADTDALVTVPFHVGDTAIAAKPAKLIDLPGGPIDHHWTKTVVASPDGKKLYVSIGSNSNVGERGMKVEEGRADIWEVDPATGDHRIYAYGIRNAVGLAYEPETKQLWMSVNERDELGSDIVPDYLALVQFGGFYGWPWYYWGGVVDKRPTDPDTNDLAETVIRPDYALGPHTASVGLTFAAGAKLGPRFADGAFVGQHGSWNRKPLSGYKVIYVPFAKGRPTGKPVDVLTGFLNADEHARGRPVGVQVDAAGGLLVADDVGNTVWRVSAS